MDNSEQLAYLEQERIKIWDKVVVLEKAINENLTSYEKIAEESAIKSGGFATQIESAKNITSQNLEESNAKIGELRNQFGAFQELKTQIDNFYQTAKENAVIIQATHDTVVGQEKNVQENK